MPKPTPPAPAASPAAPASRVRVVSYVLRAAVPAQEARPAEKIRGVVIPASPESPAVPALVRPAFVIGGNDADGLDLFVLCTAQECAGHASLTPTAVLKGNDTEAETWF